MTSARLVETVCIEYEDFNENLISCKTCLCTYDGEEHTAKLLPCCHTVCQSCLERIAAGNVVRGAASFCCPICSKTIPLPQGGVSALPPSFHVNQLLDLVSRQTREVIPKCSVHSTQELHFCETCDCVFCRECTTGVHGNIMERDQHTAIPLSFAIKEMSEIFLYKDHLCISKLSNAAENVKDEMAKLDSYVEETIEAINRSVQEIMSTIEERKKELVDAVKKLQSDKKEILSFQLSIIEAEKDKVQQQCNDGLQHQVDVRNIKNIISDLNKKLDSLNAIMEPWENAFMKYEYENNISYGDIVKAFPEFGCVRSSTTCPFFCSVSVEDCSAHLESIASVMTYDYHGTPQADGGDPLVIDLMFENGDSVKTHLVDNNNGTYDIAFLPEQPGWYKLHVTVFDRPIKSSPFQFEASENINPVCQYGSQGSGDSHLLQPVGVAIARNGDIFILDTGNSRIKVLDRDFQLIRHILEVGVEDRGGTGIALSADDSIFVVNWRTKFVTELNSHGTELRRFTHPELVEPLDLAINSKGQILVADDEASAVFVFDCSGDLMQRFGRKGNGCGEFNVITCITTCLHDEVVVCDSRIQVFTSNGKFLREILNEPKGKIHYGGITYDKKGNLLVTKYGKNQKVVHVISYQSGNLLFNINSSKSKFRRPSGISVTDDYHLILVDLGNECIKKFRYK